MSRHIQRPPIDEILPSIREKASAVRDAAEALTERIHSFEELLSKLPGRTEAFYYGEHPDRGTRSNDEISLVIGFEHQGKAWQLTVGTYILGYNDDPENPVDTKPLDDAPLKFKLAAVKMFPDLLTAIRDEQDRLKKRISDTIAEYDVFEEAFRAQIHAKGGK